MEVPPPAINTGRANYGAGESRRQCPSCRATASVVVKVNRNTLSSPPREVVRRVRACAACGKQWHTSEVISERE
jgi:transcriptional regulator NrdR family protein